MNEKIFTLPVSEQISPYISQRQLDELGVVVVSHPKVRAAVALQGAHLLAWQPSGEQPVIWLSNNTPFAKGKAIRGGVPICWPWFGPVAQPSHGFARNQPWSLTAHDEDDNGVILTFTLKDNEQTRKLWPHAFTLIARFKLGAECEIELESHGDYQATAALHSYFQVGDIDRVSVAGLGEPYIDKVAGGAEALQEGEVTFVGQTDHRGSPPSYERRHRLEPRRGALLQHGGYAERRLQDHGLHRDRARQQTAGRRRRAARPFGRDLPQP